MWSKSLTAPHYVGSGVVSRIQGSVLCRHPHCLYSIHLFCRVHIVNVGGLAKDAIAAWLGLGCLINCLVLHLSSDVLEFNEQAFLLIHGHSKLHPDSHQLVRGSCTLHNMPYQSTHAMIEAAQYGISASAGKWASTKHVLLFTVPTLTALPFPVLHAAEAEASFAISNDGVVDYKD